MLRSFASNVCPSLGTNPTSVGGFPEEPDDATHVNNAARFDNGDANQVDPAPQMNNATEVDDTALSSLQMEEQKEVLNAIDKVRALNVGCEIELPQIVVVGDQSSGKSSLLEALSGVKFPVDQGTTTRFATEIVLRHGETTTARVSIQPGPNASQEHEQFLQDFNGEGKTLDDVPSLIEQAKTHFGITSGFSQDVLQLQITGPERPHLTLVDLPGLIRGASSTNEDRKVVQDLAMGYMKMHRSIILAVVPADRDPDTEEILSLVKEADPHGQRTMGIITKADRGQAGSRSVEYYLRCATGEVATFHLGWHVVRNADFNERGTDNFNRDDAERLCLSRTPWNQLTAIFKGIPNLRRRLSRYLLELIRSEMPEVISEIEAAKAVNKEKLDKMGTARTSAKAQREFLTRIGERYQRLVLAGADGHYHDRAFFKPGDHARRLRLLIRESGSAFERRMRENGHAHEIHWTHDIDDVSYENGPPVIWRTALMDLIQDELRYNRGWELHGSYSSSVNGTIFRAMSSKWSDMAENHATTVWNQAFSFLMTLLKEICDPGTFGKIWHSLVQKELDLRRQRLRRKIEELSLPYTRGHPFTFSTRRLDEMQSRLQWLFKGVNTSSDLGTHHPDADALACMQVFIQSQALYQIALEHFVDNVTMIAVENELINGLEDILSPTQISKMSDEELAELAAESEDNLTRRRNMEQKDLKLGQALETCKRHVPYHQMDDQTPDTTYIAAVADNSDAYHSGRRDDAPIATNSTTQAGMVYRQAMQATGTPVVPRTPVQVPSSTFGSPSTSRLTPSTSIASPSNENVLVTPSTNRSRASLSPAPALTPMTVRQTTRASDSQTYHDQLPVSHGNHQQTATGDSTRDYDTMAPRTTPSSSYSGYVYDGSESDASEL